MAIRKLTPDEYDKIANSVKLRFPIEQAPPWMEFDSKLSGRKPLGLFAYYNKSDTPLALFSATKYSQPRYKMIWVKHGPIWLNPPSTKDIKAFISQLKGCIATEAPEATFIRLNLPTRSSQHASPSMHNVMYDQTVIIDLTKSDDERLADMTQSGRRALRKAWKVSLKTEELAEITNAKFTPLYEILQETAHRDSFGIHPKSLYLTMLAALGKHARLFVIYHKNQPLAWAIITVYRQNAVYYYGASSRQARQLNAPYQLHWDIMKKLKDEGVKAYDFMGIASSRHQHLKNVSVFKEKFSRTAVDVAPSYDIVMKSGRYRLLGLIRKTRQKIRFI